jgi:hypothetical protein
VVTYSFSSFPNAIRAVPISDEAVRGELRVERQVHVAVHRAGLAGDAEVACDRSAGNRLRVERAAVNQAQPAFPLGHEHVAVRQKRDAPRKRERLGDDGDANALMFGGVVHDRSRRQLLAPQPGRRDRDAAPHFDFLLAQQDPRTERRDEDECERADDAGESDLRVRGRIHSH